MSEQENMPEETSANAPALGVNDLKLMANIIEVVSNRGAIKANEMAAVGNLYNNLMTFLIANGAIDPNTEAAEDSETAVEDNAEVTEEDTND